MNEPKSRNPLIAAAMALGIGLGGFLDGIVFHQVLQLHNMLSARYPTRGIEAERLVVHLEINMFWDGLFHLFTWITTVGGLAMLWHAVRSRQVPLSTSTLIGGMLAGWGLFNLVEGVIDHHLLHIHHVTEGENHLIWDLAFLASGAILTAVGWWMIGADSETSEIDRDLPEVKLP